MSGIYYYFLENRKGIVRRFTYSILEVFGLIEVVEASSIALFVINELSKRNATVILTLRTRKVILNRLTPRLTRLVVLLGLRISLRK